MTLGIGCEGCGRLLKVRDDAVGKRIKCPHCGKVQRVVSDDVPLPSGPPEQSKPWSIKVWLILATCLGLVILGGVGYRMIWLPSAEEEAEFQNEWKLLIKMCDLMSTIKDDKSAKAAKPALDDLYTRIQELDAKTSELPEEKQKKLYARNERLVQEANIKLGDQVERAATGHLPKSMSGYLFVIAKERER